MEKRIVFEKSWLDKMRHLCASERDALIASIVCHELIGEEPGLMSEESMLVWDEISRLLRQRLQLRTRRERRKERSMIATETEQSNETEEGSPAPLVEDKEKKKEKEERKSLAEIRFEESIERDYPRLARMDAPLSLVQFQFLLEEYPLTLIQKILARMNLYKQIEIRYTSTYLTAINWLKRDIRELKSAGQWTKYEQELRSQLETIAKLKESTP